MSYHTGQKRSAIIPSDGSSTPIPHHPPKKTRFVEPDEDPVNFAEQVDSALEFPSRRGKVKTEGYDSDSSDDGEGVVFSRQPKDGSSTGLDVDEDDDMFAAAEKANEEGQQPDIAGKKQKKDQYLRLGDIEGQEFGIASGSEEGDSADDEDEPEDEDDAERRKKAGMGYELSSFNMREEMEEGKFTEDGTYVRTFDPHGVHDRWMDGLSEKEIKQAKRRKRLQEKRQKEQMEAEEKELRESGGKDSLEKQLLPMLKKGETVLKALQRLGARAKKSSKHITTTKHVGTDVATSADKAPSDIEQITHLASTIMSFGESDIYSKTYEELVRTVRASGLVDPSWQPPSADIKYEYKWDVPEANNDEQIFGPFGEDEMHAWYQASYFGTGGEKVKVRRTGGEWGSWDDIVL
ncbi:hypothetical protein AMATHDRAFT_551 [Amanita thiersii Skay4041]|uniref:GYF domain-containing protein n=1 Tax=Amanita thiersii Skay4041 TaxID=703135 RepID=A0A2A9P024_9AGAR|nr:hypothetical protein AMATHDRAFT_551 [Amanita thiersii Skay4041]